MLPEVSIRKRLTSLFSRLLPENQGLQGHEPIALAPPTRPLKLTARHGFRNSLQQGRLSPITLLGGEPKKKPASSPLSSRTPMTFSHVAVPTAIAVSSNDTYGLCRR